MVILQQYFYYHSQTAVNKNFTKKRDIRYDSYSKTLSLEIKMCMKRSSFSTYHHMVSETTRIDSVANTNFCRR